MGCASSQPAVDEDRNGPQPSRSVPATKPGAVIRQPSNQRQPSGVRSPSSTVVHVALKDSAGSMHKVPSHGRSSPINKDMGVSMPRIPAAASPAAAPVPSALSVPTTPPGKAPPSPESASPVSSTPAPFTPAPFDARRKATPSPSPSPSTMEATVTVITPAPEAAAPSVTTITDVDSLGQLADALAACDGPTVIDLGGKAVAGEVPDPGYLSISRSSVTVCNGSLLLPPETHLHITGKQVVLQALTIVATGRSGTVSGCSPAVVVISSRAHAGLQGCIIADAGPGCSCVVVAGGSNVTLEDCTFTSGGGHGVLVEGPGTRVVVRRSNAAQNEGCGFYCRGEPGAAEGTHLEVGQNCRADNNGSSGFMCSDAKMLVGQGCEARENTGSGFECLGEGATLAAGKKCKASSNKVAGFVAVDGGKLEAAKGCCADSNGTYGFFASNGGEVTVRTGCKAISNNGPGFGAGGAGAKLLAGDGCESSGNADAGFSAADGGVLVAGESCVAAHNQSGFLSQQSGSKVVVATGCVANDNLQYSFMAVQGAEIEMAQGCEATGNNNGTPGFNAASPEEVKAIVAQARTAWAVAGQDSKKSGSGRAAVEKSPSGVQPSPSFVGVLSGTSSYAVGKPLVTIADLVAAISDPLAPLDMDLKGMALSGNMPSTATTRNIVIDKDNVVLRDGALMLPDGVCLEVRAQNVKLNELMIMGSGAPGSALLSFMDGATGEVWKTYVSQNSETPDCCGILLAGDSMVELHEAVVQHVTAHGVAVEEGSVAELDNSSAQEAGGEAICVLKHGGRAVAVKGVENGKYSGRVAA